MLKFLAVFVVIGLTPLFADFTQEELTDPQVRAEIEMAVEDYGAGLCDENGSEVYLRAMDELEENAVKSSTAEGVALGVFATLFLSSASSASSGAAYDSLVRDCINRCMRWDDLPYRFCKRDCLYDYNTH